MEIRNSYLIPKAVSTNNYQPIQAKLFVVTSKKKPTIKRIASVCLLIFSFKFHRIKLISSIHYNEMSAQSWWNQNCLLVNEELRSIVLTVNYIYSYSSFLIFVHPHLLDIYERIYLAKKYGNQKTNKKNSVFLSGLIELRECE